MTHSLSRKRDIGIASGCCSADDNLGHTSLATTSLYLHADDDLRHRETEKKHRVDW